MARDPETEIEFNRSDKEIRNRFQDEAFVNVMQIQDQKSLRQLQD